jgi:hypothetical protein
MKNLAIVCISTIYFVPSAFSQTVSLRLNKASQPQLYAASVLEAALIKKGYNIKNASAFYQIDLTINAKQLGAESFSIKHTKQTITITGGDDRGLIYGCLSLAEDIRNGIALKDCRTKNEKPVLPFRAIKYDLPWDTYRHSYALELHDQTCRDTVYWKGFLDMMAENRFNTLTLWNLHPYTFLIRPKNFPEASPWNDKEMKEWETLFHSIIRMATERAIETYIIPFNIFVTPEFAKAHNVAMDNLAHDYFVNGDTSEIIKRYTRESVTQMLEEYPGLTGMGLTLGEGMGEMTPQQREDWITATIIEGMRLANRKSKLIHRIPFSSTTGSAGPTSIETEKLTRKSIEKQAAMGFTEGPIWADLKFNWSHAHSTTKLIKVHGGKLYDTYFKPEPAVYKIVWTARNEDFFCLRWGVPSFVRNHILQNMRPYSGGYIIGSETYIPAKDYFTRDSIDLHWRYAFERQWLFYKLWGRLMYDPNISDELFKKEFTRRYGNMGEHLLAASALAGNTPLQLASYFDCGWDFTLYSEGMMALDNTTKRVDYISVDRLIKQPPLDTSYVSVADYVKRSTSAVTFDKKEITPLMLAAVLEKDCNGALKLVSKINISGNKALVYEVADIKAWSYLGLHFAEKIRGAVALQTYRSRGGDTNREKAIKYLQKALTYWDSLIHLTQPLYKDMPLVHLSQQGGKESKENFFLNFHWEKLRSDVARDVEIAEQAVEGK